LEFKPGSKEREAVENSLKEIESKTEEVPIMIGDEAIWTNDIKYQVSVSGVFSIVGLHINGRLRKSDRTEAQGPLYRGLA